MTGRGKSTKNVANKRTNDDRLVDLENANEELLLKARKLVEDQSARNAQLAQLQALVETLTKNQLDLQQLLQQQQLQQQQQAQSSSSSSSMQLDQNFPPTLPLSQLPCSSPSTTTVSPAIVSSAPTTPTTPTSVVGVDQVIGSLAKQFQVIGRNLLFFRGLSETLAFGSRSVSVSVCFVNVCVL